MNRRGYTLIEMLIALVLVVTLMSAAWGLTSLYNRFLTIGRAQATDQQIARSLFQLIQDDVGLVSLPVRPREGQSASAARGDWTEDPAAAREEYSMLRRSFFESADSASGESIDAGSMATDEELGLFSGFMNALAEQGLNLPPLEFTGSATEFRMTVVLPTDSRPAQSVDETGQSSTTPLSSLPLPAGLSDDANSLQPDISRLVTIVYQFEAPGMSTALDRQLPAGLHRIEVPTLQLRQMVDSARFDRSEDSGGQLPDSRQQRGSAEIDRFTLQALLTPVPEIGRPQADETVALPEPRHEHIAEVVHFELEYFDGATWFSSWDSSESLPTAIRIGFGLVSQNELKAIAAVFADTATNEQPVTPLAENDIVDPLAAIKPRRFERILVLSSEDPPEFAPFGDDEFMGGARDR